MLPDPYDPQSPSRAGDGTPPVELVSEDGVVLKVLEPTSVSGQLKDSVKDAYLAKIELGAVPAEAARDLGVEVADMNHDPVVRAAVKELTQKYKLTAKERRDLARARVNQIVLTGEDKDALTAVKLVMADPETGMSGGMTIGAEVLPDGTARVLAHLPALEE